MKSGAAKPRECSRDRRRCSDFAEREFLLLRQMLAKGVNSPVTSSAGRLFDAVASLIGSAPACDL